MKLEECFLHLSYGYKPMGTREWCSGLKKNDTLILSGTLWKGLGSMALLRTCAAEGGTNVYSRY